MDTKRIIMQKLLGRLNVRSFTAGQCVNKLASFAKKPYTYKRLLLQGKFSRREGKQFCFSEPVLKKSEPRQSNDAPNIVNMTPSICSSFAIWPEKSQEADDLLEACKDKHLHPQFVFLALNWSTRLGLKKRDNGECVDASGFFAKQPRWSTFHKILPANSQRKSQFVVKGDPLINFFSNNHFFRGAYLTDFVKGMVDSNSNEVYEFLKKQSHIQGKRWFDVYMAILKNELKALDNVFELNGSPKFLIVFGPTLYDKLQSFCGEITLERLFPDRIVLRTGGFYSNRWKEDEIVLKNLRQLYYPSAAGPFGVKDFSIQWMR